MKKNLKTLTKFKIYHLNQKYKKANNNRKMRIKIKKHTLNQMILWLEENIF